MKKDLEKLHIDTLVRPFVRYRVLIFVVIVGLIYGYIVLQISSLSNIEPSEASISAEYKAFKSPSIDKTVIEQLRSLKDNSVSVQALFDNNRNNPFQE
jgi:hypothetical protein